MTRLLALFLVTLAIPAASPAHGGELALSQEVGQLIVMSFKGTVAPPYVLAALRERRAAGVILFRGNVSSPRQLRTLTRQLSRAGSNPVIAVDQEGGSIRIVPWAPPVASAPEQAEAGKVGQDARAAATALRSAGITVSLAPVADVPSVPRAALAGRSFSRRPERASEAVAAAVAGWRAGGIAPTAKHFPGLGGARVNTDERSVTIARTRSQIEVGDLTPFRAAIRAGAPIVMISHARYPALDGHRIASQSRAIIEGLLRGELGFRGVTMTDSMEAQASLATGSITAVSERAVRAGADLLLLTGRGSYRPVYRHLLAKARHSASFRERVREAAARVLALRAGL